jgi:heme-degrading monooxygenase HmoA
LYARVPTFKISVQSIDASIRYFEEATSAQLRKIPGFRGGTMLVNRDEGIVRIVALWESREALDSSFEPTKALRAAYSDKFGAELVSLEEFEVAVQTPPDVT